MVIGNFRAQAMKQRALADPYSIGISNGSAVVRLWNVMALEVIASYQFVYYKTKKVFTP